MAKIYNRHYEVWQGGEHSITLYNAEKAANFAKIINESKCGTVWVNEITSKHYRFSELDMLGAKSKSELSREQLEHMVDVLANMVLSFADAQTAEILLRAEGLETEELEAIGFDVEV